MSSSRRRLSRRHQLRDDLIDAEARRLLPRREFLEALEPLLNDRLRGVLVRDVLDEPVIVFEAILSALERIGPKVEHLGDAQDRQWLTPDVESRRALFGEHDLELMDAKRHQVAVIAPVEEALTRRCLFLAGEERLKV